MRNIFTVLILFLAISANAQDLNKTIEDPNRHKQVMLNLCTRDSVTSFPEFKASYDANYGNYKVDSTTVTQISKLMKGKKVTIVLGTWCGDSKYQVPNFLKIMDAAKIGEESMKFIGVDGMKKAENGLIDSLNITRVPTFIFTDKKGKEVARITERPTETLEKDMLKLLAVQPKKATAKTK